MEDVRVFSAGDNLQRFGGAQKVMVDVHNGIKKRYQAKVLGRCSFEEIDENYGIKRGEYHKLVNPLSLKNAVVLIHARKLATYYHILNKLFFLNLRLIYVSHNIYENLKCVTFLPKNIVSISDKVTKNLVEYFNIPKDNITKIHNGIRDKASMQRAVKIDSSFIQILYPARINDVKRQVEVVKFLKGKLKKNVCITFAGAGPKECELRSLITGDSNFHFLGFVKNMEPVISDSDYIMLFSKKEGLPISLMEGVRDGKPLIINDVGGNLEIGKPDENAFVANNWEDLLSVVNNLPFRFEPEYLRRSEMSLELFERNFKYEDMIHKYCTLINNVACGGRNVKQD
ncbi:glycosyltransferase family 4 protein [Sphingobacterium psychroaquaticum]|uniref:Glycosyltransferase involved in cell wall bisynthesis n=1 Tax=Sphingobacterium psychroaquaticum TaxID=561061 RepID=A0A1X7L2U8_9SPHI|nr:glycosyltransferase family 4 protein [Sphingobacterium psychroaquaticum]QBQ39828.1 glycosyltransferase [Sphingobacterium psychroaquaticum]SMG47542.1 Glycosyltransferase involved in cell wall bisynthesis [Sphingobacterium psychroaquaticum]